MATGLLASAAALTVGATPASADAAFTLVSSAQGASITVENSSFPFVSSVEVNAPTAIATLNNRGAATGYSAVPDPGQTIAELPTTAAGTLCAQFASNGLKIPACDQVIASIPSYPYAYAQAGDPPQDKSLPAAHLHAEATSASSEARTTSGADGAAQAVSLARTLSSSDGMDAVADSSVNSLELAAYLKLRGVDSTASLHRAPDGTVKMDSSFDVGSMSINGQTIGLHDGTFMVLGSPVPVPIPVQTVLDLFKSVGVVATYLPATKTADSITSAGLMLSYQVPGAPAGIVPSLPPTPLPVSIGVPTTPTTVTYLLGRVTTMGSYKSIPDLTSIVSGGAGSFTESPASSSGGSVPGASSLGSPLVTSSAPGLGSGSGPTMAPSSPHGSAPAALRAFSPLTSHGLDIYLLFVVAALLAFGSATAVRFLGVRHAWFS